VFFTVEIQRIVIFLFPIYLTY